MQTKHLVLAALFVTSTLGACTQQSAAPILNKAGTDYTRDKSYAMNAAPKSAYRSTGGAAPVSLAPSEPASYEQTARVESIGVKDLGAPDAAAKPQPTQNSFVTSYGSNTKVAAAAPASRGAGDRPFQSGESQYTGNRHLDNAGSVQSAVAVKKPTGDLAQKALDDAITTPRLTANAAKGDMIWPVKGKVLSGFGPKGSGVINDGMNIQAAAGTPVRAAAAGRVAYAGDKIKGYGNMVLLTHNSGRNTTYAHLSKLSVIKGGKVKQGDVIGYVGDTGNVKSPQLHFAVREGKTPVNPEQLIHSALASAQ